MTKEEVQAALIELGVSQTELASELGVNGRTVRRWVNGGCDGTGAVAVQSILRMHRLGLAWRKNQISIGVAAGGRIVQLTDAEAAARHHRIMTTGMP